LLKEVKKMKKIIWILPIVVAFFSYPFCEEITIEGDPYWVRDAYVTSASEYYNSGGDDSLSVSIFLGDEEIQQAWSYIWFRKLDDYFEQTLVSAKLCLYKWPGPVYESIGIYAVAETWGEYTINWKFKPEHHNEPQIIEDTWMNFTYNEVDVTEIAQLWFDGEYEYYGFCLKPEQEDLFHVAFHSTDYVFGNPPYMVIDVVPTSISGKSLGAIKCLYR